MTHRPRQPEPHGIVASVRSCISDLIGLARFYSDVLMLCALIVVPILLLISLPLVFFWWRARRADAD